MSYTKLKWRVATKENNCCIGKVDPECGEYNGIAAGAGHSGNGFLLAGYISKADVTLMAAAPDLLEALQALMKCAVKLAENETTDAAAPIWAYIEDANEAIRKAVDIA
jgi:hypothetical protein